MRMCFILYNKLSNACILIGSSGTRGAAKCVTDVLTTF